MIWWLLSQSECFNIAENVETSEWQLNRVSSLWNYKQGKPGIPGDFFVLERLENSHGILLGFGEFFKNSLFDNFIFIQNDSNLWM